MIDNEEVRTPTDDEREALRAEAEEVQRAAWAEIHGQDPTRTYSVAEVKQLVYAFDNVLSSALRRTEVPESSGFLSGVHLAADSLTRKKGAWTRQDALEYLGIANTPEPQGEPSDAQVEAGCAAFYEGAQGLTSWALLVAAEPDLANRYRDGIRAALRAAGGAR